MRLVWWIIFFAVACMSNAWAQPSGSGSSTSASLSGLQISPDLQIHKTLNEDRMTVFLVADKMRTDAEGKIILTGSAEVRRIDSVVKGDYIDYQRSNGQMHVRGNGLILRDASIVTGPELNYNVKSETGDVSNPDFWLGANGGAGTAVKADIFSKSKMRLSDVVYSGCPCPEPSWYIKSPTVDLNFAENEGVARNGVLYFKGVPILASPYLSFPLRKERKSGFLVPTYGVSSNSGFELSTPYYFNLAPNYDATLTPRYMSKRGTQLGGEFRYLGDTYSGQVAGTYLSNDLQTRSNRWMYSAQHNQTLGNGFSASYDIRRVSDNDYFRDFSTFGLNEATTNLLPSVAQLNWSGAEYWSSYLQTYTYQTLQDRTAGYTMPPFDKLPELYVRGARYNWGGFDVISDNYATKFRMPHFSDDTHSYPFASQLSPNQSYDGERFMSYTTVAYPIQRAGWYVTPKVGLHMTEYNTNWHGSGWQISPTPGPHSQSRILPIMSVDSGMTFERDTRLFGNDSVQTLEPRLYYLYVPYTNQSLLPVYDTAVSTFNFSQAFDENRYSGGWDRISNANQLTLGLTSRWLDADTGFERLSLSAAQRIYFTDQRVTLPGETPRTDNSSDYLVGANAALTDKLSVRFDGQYNPKSGQRNQMTAGFRWQPKRLASVSVAYLYQRNPLQILNPALDSSVAPSKDQVTLSGQWPIVNKLSAMGRVDYSLEEKRTTQSVLGLEYKGDCCWTARVVMQRYAVSAQQVNTALFFQLELSGLGSLGTDPMSLLRRTISDYESTTPPIPEKTNFERYE
ncbi:MAG TPA: LPS-assembly protein LptD [Paralcaligenes sp.]